MEIGGIKEKKKKRFVFGQIMSSFYNHLQLPKQSCGSKKLQRGKKIISGTEKHTKSFQSKGQVIEII